MTRQQAFAQMIFELDGKYDGRILLHTGEWIEVPDAEEADFLVRHLNQLLTVPPSVTPISAVYDWSHSTAFQALMDSEVEPRLHEIEVALRAWFAANGVQYPDTLAAINEVARLWGHIGMYIELDLNKFKDVE